MGLVVQRLTRSNNQSLKKRHISPVIKKQKRKSPIQSCPIIGSNTIISDFKEGNTFEIFAYCSKNYKDAFNFVVPSWTKWDSVKKVTIYTDWPCKCKDPKVDIINMFEPDSDWIIGTGRRLDVIKKFSDDHGLSNQNVLFLDIDCLITKDVSHVFNKDFDIAITRLYSKESHTNKTATAGLWFARLNKGYFNFINEWFDIADEFKSLGIGIKKYHISYVQYSFTKVAKQLTNKYSVLPIDENVYNSEHTLADKWLEKIHKFQPYILHYKGRRFRDLDLVDKTLKAAGIRI